MFTHLRRSDRLKKHQPRAVAQPAGRKRAHRAGRHPCL